jgi:hypothetical protein
VCHIISQLVDLREGFMNALNEILEILDPSCQGNPLLDIQPLDPICITSLMHDKMNNALLQIDFWTNST